MPDRTSRNSNSLKVIREWKRDHSINTMDLEDAAINLSTNCTDLAMRKKGKDLIREYLEAGLVMETPKAKFYLKELEIKFDDSGNITF
jgi:hypothetical protein